MCESTAVMDTIPVPDNHSRVILEPVEGDPESDYVNANYIDVSSAICVLFIIHHTGFSYSKQPQYQNSSH